MRTPFWKEIADYIRSAVDMGYDKIDYWELSDLRMGADVATNRGPLYKALHYLAEEHNIVLYGSCRCLVLATPPDIEQMIRHRKGCADGFARAAARLEKVMRTKKGRR